MPPTRQEFDELKEIISNLQQVEDVPFIENLKRRLGFGSVSVADGASSTGTTISVRNAADDGSETVADDYDGVLTLSDTQGNSFRVGYYN